jgi:Domain of Unknown Function (DUF1259)
MPKITCARFVRDCAVRMLVLAVVLLPTKGAFAATDWSAIQAAMGTDGYVFTGDVLRFQLARHDLTISVDGVPIQQPGTAPWAFNGAVANGFVAFKEKRRNDFFADGALPAQESELSALEDSLLSHGRAIRITAVYSHVTNISPKLIWVHFEATGPGADLATFLATALATIHSPQLGVSFVPGSNFVFDPSLLPQPILDLFEQGFLAQVDNVFVFWLPRPDECSISLDSRVAAQSGLGVGQTFYIQVNFSGGADITINIDFALRPHELPAVQSILRSGGFTLPSQSNNYVSDNPRLHYLHATASGNGILIGATLFKAVKVIGLGNGGNRCGIGGGNSSSSGNGDGDHDGDDH